jgi:hypothetical protein
MSDNQSSTIVSGNTPPTVTVYGCGGGGINMVRRALPEFKNNATYRYIDTSKLANLLAGEEAIIMGSGEGSGGVRQENADPVIKAIASLSDEDLGLADVNIVVFSVAGGSGSVIAPLLIKDIAGRRKRLVIALVISATQSKMHTNNTLKTLQSLRNITDEIGLYLPISIFDNNAGIKAVDQTMPYKLARLVDLLTAPTIEIDKNDRLNWINVPKTLGVSMSGLRLLYVTTATESTMDAGVEVRPNPDGYIYDSLLAIRTDNYEVLDRPRVQASFEGLFATIKLVPMYGVIGNPPKAFDDLLKHIKDTLTEYDAHSEQHEDPFASNTPVSARHKSGLQF